MRTSDIKRYLNKYGQQVEKIKRSQERIQMIDAALENKAIELGGLQKGNKTSKPTEAAVIRLIEAKERLQKQIIISENLRQTISDDIELIPEPLYKELLFSRYILLMTWEGVTDRVSETRRRKNNNDKAERYSVAHVMGPMHGRALQSFKIHVTEREDRHENFDSGADF